MPSFYAVVLGTVLIVLAVMIVVETYGWFISRNDKEYDYE